MTENLDGKEIIKTYQELPIWTGAKILDTYGSKTVLDYKGQPLFAELYALRTFKEIGYDGVWADTYRRKFRTELPERNESKISLPDFVQNRLDKINPDGKLSGTWDLILWRNNEIRFVELKRQRKDKIRKTQIDFLNKALESGFSVDSFEIYEWIEK